MMNGLFGIRDPRMQGRYPTAPRETIPERGGAVMGPAPMQSGSGGLMGGSMSGQPNYQSPSQGLFQMYMQQLFNQKYAPPVIPGSPGSISQFNGYRGFGSPAMTPVAPPQQQALPPPNYRNVDDPGYVFDWRTYNQT